MSTTLVNFRLDTQLKKKLEKLCDELGMNLTTAFTIFAKKMVREQGIPFRINKESYGYEDPNEETIAAFEEGERMLRDPNSKTYNSSEELFDELDAE
ncbi:MAG: type II toxin-antitoxin system RelB/DinJ family antitoxin [Candidatus Riflebacteria bacterium]|nr:type II toxin-antitoxin system RelB/DinJ family antitoxin [Candidatus Riflebacteria bacterium]